MLCLCHFTVAQSYNFIKYDISDGLVHDKVLDITEDHFGNLWIATLQGGLSRFNGLEFENFTIRDGLGSNFVRDIMVDKHGNVWAATASGLSMYNGQVFENYTIDTAEENNNSISVIAEGDNCIWFAMPKGGVGRFDLSTKNITSYELDGKMKNDKVICIKVDEKGAVWVISVVNGLFKLENNAFVNVIQNADFKGYLLSIYTDASGILWLGSNKGLLRYDPDKPNVINDFFDPLKGLFIKSAAVKDSSNFWALSAFGLVRVENGVFKPLSKTEGLTETKINTVYCDREGTVWAGTDGEGIYKLVNETFIHFGAGHGLNGKPVTAIARDFNNRYYIGTHGGGVDVYDGNKFSNLGMAEGLSNTYISCAITDKQGNVWFGTRGSGLIKYDGETFAFYDKDDGLIFNTVRCMYNDSQNNLWVGTPNGLSKYDGRSFENYTIDNGLHDNTIWNFQELYPGKVMVVTREGISYFVEGREPELFREDNIFDKRINMVVEDEKGNYWIGYSGHGVLKYNKYSGLATKITTEKGLTSDLIYNLIFDEDGNLLVGSERGIDKIYLDEDKQILRIKSFTEIEGFKGLQTIPNAFYKEYDGNIWFGSSEGIFKYQPGKETKNTTEPITYISGLKLFYNEVDWSSYSDSLSSWFTLPHNLKLPYNKNSLVVEYFGSSHINPQEVKYQFRLKGFETDWSPPTKKSEAVYTNLPPGDYTFEVKASNSDGVWNEQAAQFSFLIVPPFWQEAWFFAVMVLIFLIAIKLFNDYRIKANLNKVLTIERIRAEELVKVRKRMARDFHDNMGNQLASITVFANLINMKLKDKSSEVDELLQNIEKHTKSLFNGTKDFIWSIDPESDDIEEIFTYIKDFGEELYGNVPIDFYSEVIGIQGKHTSVPSGYSRHIVLIFKEAMTNALKHSKATEVYFGLNLKGREFVIELNDNGEGISSEKLRKGNGFKNMRSRASQINCNIQVESNPKPGGTRVTLYGVIESDQTSRKMKIF
nr:sensor histidine kinase [Fulvivirga aurantia]